MMCALNMIFHQDTLCCQFFCFVVVVFVFVLLLLLLLLCVCARVCVEKKEGEDNVILSVDYI
jgi:hypothetical protein